jgi:hypothetical protein
MLACLDTIQPPHRKAFHNAGQYLRITLSLVSLIRFQRAPNRFLI